MVFLIFPKNLSSRRSLEAGLWDATFSLIQCVISGRVSRTRMVKGRVRSTSSGTAELWELGTSSQTPGWRYDVLPLLYPFEVFTHTYTSILALPQPSAAWLKPRDSRGEMHICSAINIELIDTRTTQGA